MALQGRFANHEGEYDQAYYKVIRASVVAEDYEVVKPLESGEVETVEYRTLHKGQAVAMVWSDNLAYKNRAVPLHAFYVNFEIPDSGVNILEAAYKAIQEGDPDQEYLYI